MKYILVIWIWGSAPPVVVEKYGTLAACEGAGGVWDNTQRGRDNYSTYHVCLPHQ